MNTVIIRTCERDDLLAKLCYESFIGAGIIADYYFFAEIGKYKFITECRIPIKYREHADNLGGRSNVVKYAADLKQFDVNNGYVIISDSDIFVKTDFTKDLTGDICGVVSKQNDWHISGQMMILKHDLFNKILKQDIYELCSEVNRFTDVADDTAFSWYAKKNHWDIQPLEGYWIHDKDYYKK